MFFQPQGWGLPTTTGGPLGSETEPSKLSSKFVFVVPVSSTVGFLSLPLCWVFFVFSFHHWSFCVVGLLLCLASALQGLSQGYFSQVKSKKRHHICQRSEVKSLSHVRLFATPWTVAYQAPLSMRFSRQEYWSGLPFPSPGDLPNPGIKPRSPTV